MFPVDFCQDMASKRRTSFDLAAFFDLETLDGALDTFHFWHMYTPLQIFFHSEWLRSTENGRYYTQKRLISAIFFRAAFGNDKKLIIELLDIFFALHGELVEFGLGFFLPILPA